MPLIETLALALIVLAGLYLLALGAASFLMPVRASRFLLGFASSGPAHYAELLLRALVGAALVLRAPGMMLPGAFSLAGWILLASTACLLLIPWRWHRRFAQQVVPRAIGHIRFLGSSSLVMGALILVAVVRGNAA